MTPPLLVATRNAHKTREIAAMLEGRFIVSDLMRHPDAPEVEETGATFAENAALKATEISSFTGGWALADDSGLEVHSLDGAPGVRSARYAGDPASDSANNQLLLENLKSLRGRDRSANFRCVLALAHRGKLVATFDGRVDGVIINRPKGAEGFGYDPLFVPDGYCQTFGELPASVKNAISHRARALRQFADWLEASGGTIVRPAR